MCSSESDEYELLKHNLKIYNSYVQLLYLQQKLTVIITEAKTQLFWLAYDRSLQFSIRGASCDLGCSPW